MRYKLFTVSMFLIALVLFVVGCYVRQSSDSELTDAQQIIISEADV